MVVTEGLLGPMPILNGARRYPCATNVHRRGLTLAPASLAVLTTSVSAPKSGAVGSRPTVVWSGLTRCFLTTWTPLFGNTRGAAGAVAGGCGREGGAERLLA